MTPRLLDLFCGAGGAAEGYRRAGFDVVGVDSAERLNYPFERRVADAVDYLDAGGWLGFDAIHASPPCQAYSAGTRAHGDARDAHPRLIKPIRERLINIGLPYVIENVKGAPLINPMTLCGTAFDLYAPDPKSGLICYLRRHRLFESNVYLWAAPCRCAEFRRRDGWIVGGVYSGASRSLERARMIRHGGYTPAPSVGRAMMGIDWMTWSALTQSIPPAYTEWIGRQLIEALR